MQVALTAQSSRILGQQQQQRALASCSAPARGFYRAFAPASRQGRSLCRAQQQESETEGPKVDVNVTLDLDKEVTKFARNAATTFAPRASTASKNPAYKGSVLYTVFEVQAWLALAVGGLLSFNILFPSDQPDIARLIGMWSIWMFTIPSLRARECTQPEKDALNLLFIAIPLLNVALPFVWKSFPFIYVADCVVLAGVFAWKGLLPGGSGGEAEAEQ